MSKMGISTLQSYCGAQIFEAVGLEKAFVDKCFTRDRLANRRRRHRCRSPKKSVERHRRAFPTLAGERPPSSIGAANISGGGTASTTCSTRDTVFKLQHATRSGQYSRSSRSTAKLVDDQSTRHATLRGLLELKRAGEPIPIDEVESVDSIVKRFATGAMSYGSISLEAHETLAIAMNRIGGKSNTGEGGEDPARYVPDANGDSRRSAIKQVASARFGVTSEYLVSADDLQIKMAQGAKPGEGGQLPATRCTRGLRRCAMRRPASA